jgi:hypothetical protein
VPETKVDLLEKFIVALIFCLVAWAFMSISSAVAERKLQQHHDVAPIITIY